MSIKELVNDFLSEVKITKSNNTYTNYMIHLREFVNFCEEHKIEDILTWNGKETKNYRNYLVSKGYKASTVNTKISALKSFFDYLVEEQVLKGNPITSRVYLKQEQNTPRFLTEAELRKIDLAIDSIRNDVGLLFKLQLSTGIRLAEALNLKSEDILLIDNALFVKVKGKGSKERIVPVLDEFTAKELLRLKNKNEGKIFNFSRSLVLYYADVLKKKTGVDFHSHRLRHTVATRLLNNGVQIDVVQQVLGHASISTTRRYAKTSNEAVKRLAVKIK